MHLPQNAAISMVTDEARVTGRGVHRGAGGNEFQSIFSGPKEADGNVAVKPSDALASGEPRSPDPKPADADATVRTLGGETGMMTAPLGAAPLPLPDAKAAEPLPEQEAAELAANPQMAEPTVEMSPEDMVFGAAAQLPVNADGRRVQITMTPVLGPAPPKTSSTKSSAMREAVSGVPHLQKTGASSPAATGPGAENLVPVEETTAMRSGKTSAVSAAGTLAARGHVLSGGDGDANSIDQNESLALSRDRTTDSMVRGSAQMSQAVGEAGDSTPAQTDRGAGAKMGGTLLPDPGNFPSAAMRNAPNPQGADTADPHAMDHRLSGAQSTQPANPTGTGIGAPVSQTPAESLPASPGVRGYPSGAGHPESAAVSPVTGEAQGDAKGGLRRANTVRAGEAAAEPMGVASAGTGRLSGATESVFEVESAFSETALGEARVATRGSAASAAHIFQAPETPRHAALQIAEIVRASGERMVELRLQPEELGRVHLTMSQDATGTLTVALNVERAETLDLLRRNIDLLGAQLRGLGYENVDFSFQGDGAGAQGGRPDTGTAAAGPQEVDEAAPRRTLPPRPEDGLNGSAGGGIDLRL